MATDLHDHQSYRTAFMKSSTTLTPRPVPTWARQEDSSGAREVEKNAREERAAGDPPAGQEASSSAGPGSVAKARPRLQGVPPAFHPCAGGTPQEWAQLPLRPWSKATARQTGGSPPSFEPSRSIS